MTGSSRWSRIEVAVLPTLPDAAGEAALHALRLAGLQARRARVHQVTWIEAEGGAGETARRLLVDPVTEEGSLGQPLPGQGTAVSVWKRPGVMDPAEASILRALATLRVAATRAVTGKTYWIEADAPEAAIVAAVGRSLANEVIEEIGPGLVPQPKALPAGAPARAAPLVPLDGLPDADLLAVSRRYRLALDVAEMRAVAQHFRGLGRAPRLGELETIAQTWSEHCKHKTLTGPIDYEEGGRTERIGNLLKETIFRSTQTLARPWCVSVFKDNAGIIRFDEEHDVCFKVETHNHPSALEPYGGAGTGVGGVIRDILGTGLGARPIANTDVFCFGDLDEKELPKGVLHPLRVLRGVVAGVRDYGNRMGIPTVNGAVVFDRRYLGNPLVYCGTVGILPRGMHEKAARPGDRIVCAGGRTGRDGIHGATFSSETLHDASDRLSGGAVQIGNAIEEKRLLDTLLAARDRRLFTAVTDCGAGGLSSAVGEMGAEIGARVQLERVPLKYQGLDPVEIWISEAQERMVLAVPPEKEAELLALFASEDVEATVLGEFTGDGRLLVTQAGQTVVDLSMEFLHEGLPKRPRAASWSPPPPTPASPPAPVSAADLLALLSHGNVCSKEWIVRQYDHEVQAGSAIKPLVGPEGRGPGDAAVVVPLLGSRRGVVIANGICPRFGDLDPYAMAQCAVDEAHRNAVCVGADPERIALLDNFSWGDCTRPEVLGAMVRAARGCHDAALLFGSPFISGKDSLNNEFRTDTGSIRIPHTLLISALGRIEDVTKAVTSDLKRPGSRLVLVGSSYDESGGALFRGGGGRVPRVRATAPAVLRAVAAAIASGRVLACHDLSDGGLAVAAAEMAIGGGLGFRLDPRRAPRGEPFEDLGSLLFGESPTRFLLEMAQEPRFDVPHAVVGRVLDEPRLEFEGAFSVPLAEARAAFFAWERLL
ncbi:MAG: phosphoribosylformylglycinamidine synthase subunit PurL [Planctomycetaceae bacterium]